jgi:hypothetical protein
MEEITGILVDLFIVFAAAKVAGGIRAPQTARDRGRGTPGS